MKELKTDIATLKFNGIDYLEIVMDEDVELDIFKVKKHFQEACEFTYSQKLQSVLDLRNLRFSHIPIEVMDYLAKSPYNKYQFGVALIIDGLAQKLLGNFYLNVVKPQVPTKLFTNYDDAKQWLKEISEKESASL